MVNPGTALATTQLSDYEGVRIAMQAYIDGVLQGRSDLMKPSFHPAASFFGYYNGTLMAGCGPQKFGPSPQGQAGNVS